MALNIQIEVQKQFAVTASFDEVLDLLGDVPRSTSHFPQLEKLIPLGDNAFRWEMEKLGTDKYNVQLCYACKYTTERDKGMVRWEPVKGVGNGEIAGTWEVAQTSPVQLTLKTKGTLTLPFPRLLRRLIEPFVQKEFARLIKGYAKNLQKTLGVG